MVNTVPECTCLHGVCDNRVTGSTGRCKPFTCEAGYSGTNCDTKIQRCDRRSRLRCHAFADCVRQNPADILSRIARLTKFYVLMSSQAIHVVIDCCQFFLFPSLVEAVHLS